MTRDEIRAYAAGRFVGKWGIRVLDLFARAAIWAAFGLVFGSAAAAIYKGDPLAWWLVFSHVGCVVAGLFLAAGIYAQIGKPQEPTP